MNECRRVFGSWPVLVCVQMDHVLGVAEQCLRIYFVWIIYSCADIYSSLVWKLKATLSFDSGITSLVHDRENVWIPNVHTCHFL